MGHPYYKLEGLEGRIDLQKIQTIRGENKNMLGGHIEEGGRSDKIPKSLSIFTRDLSRPRPFSALLNQHTSYESKISSKNRGISEIEQIKQKMAKNKIFIDAKTLERGLLIPEGVGKSEINLQILEPTIAENNLKKLEENNKEKKKSFSIKAKPGSAVIKKGKDGDSPGKKTSKKGNSKGKRPASAGNGRGEEKAVEGERREVYMAAGRSLLKNPFIVEKKKKKRSMKKKKK